MSYFELYQENPSLFLIVLLISFVVTIFVYGAFPLIFAKTTKKPITKKKYKRLCYGLNIIGMAFFIVLNGAASGGPYFLWTWIFSNYGVKILNSRDLMKDNGQSNGLNSDKSQNNFCENMKKTTEKSQQNPDLDIDKMSPQEAAEYLVAEQLGEKYTPKVERDKKPKVKYCSQCGSQIDPVTKKCTGCSKQYFRRFKFTKFFVVVTALTLVIAILSTICVLQYINIQKSKDKTSPLETLTTSSNVATMTVAIEADFVPYSWIKDGNYYGLHVDISKEIAKRTGKNISFVVVDFHDMISGVDSGLYDMAFGLEKTPDREKIVAFTDEYYDGMCAIYYTKGEKASFSEWTEHVKILNDIKEDGTLRNLLSKYNLS